MKIGDFFKSIKNILLRLINFLCNSSFMRSIADRGLLLFDDILANFSIIRALSHAIVSATRLLLSENNSYMVRFDIPNYLAIVSIVTAVVPYLDMSINVFSMTFSFVLLFVIISLLFVRFITSAKEIKLYKL